MAAGSAPVLAVSTPAAGAAGPTPRGRACADPCNPWRRPDVPGVRVGCPANPWGRSDQGHR
eukprot:12796568-Alexandrium_andersonii.AAC.1